MAELPWGFQLSVNSSFISTTPAGANFSFSTPLPGTVPAGSTEPLPGIPWDSLAGGTSKTQLAAAVAAFNTKYPTQQLALPPNYSLSAPIFSQDFRLTKKFTFKERYQLSIMAEMFNAFNISNLIIGSYTLDAAGSTSYAFGQPVARYGQSLGQGGARAVQLGARVSF